MTRDKAPFTKARHIAPAAFNRWVIGGTSLAVAGYGLLAIADLRDLGIQGALAKPHLLMTVITLVAVIVAVRIDAIVGCAITLASVWLEIQTSIVLDHRFPAAGTLVLPVLVMAVGLLLGRGVALVATIVTVAVTIVTTWMSAAGLASDFVISRWLMLHAISMAGGWLIMWLSLSGFARVYEAMLANEKDLSDTIRFAPDGLLVVNEAGSVMLVNPAAESLLGLPALNIAGKCVGTLVAEATGDIGVATALLAAGPNVAQSLVLVRRNADVLHLEATWHQMDGGRRQLLLRDVTGLVRDAAQRRELEMQLAHSQRLDAVGRLAGGLAHDFNNILTAVSGSAEMLRTATDTTLRRELVDEIIAARDRGASVTRQLLAFARREVTQPRVVQVSAYVRDLERLLQRVGGDRCTLVLALAGQDRVRIDPGQLEHALVNLVANARDAMPDGGTCTVTVERIENAHGQPQVLLHVADTGVGMSVEVAAHAFEPFFTTKARGKGTGLGLASVHGMAVQGGGRAFITDLSGGGTRVSIQLPTVDAEVTPEEPTAVFAMPKTGGQSILLAEDDDGTRRVVERMLEAAGYRVIVAADGSEAKAIVSRRDQQIDFVLSDVMMPGCTGPQLADFVTAQQPGTPVLLMTGYASDQIDELLAGDMSRAVITKPFAASALIARIATMLDPATNAAVARV